MLTLWLWLGVARSPLPAMFAAAGAWLAAAGGAWHWWRGQFHGELQWDGQQWVLDGLVPGRPPLLLQGAPEVQWDLQGQLWVGVQAAQGGRRFWLWLECRLQPERWPDLRRAVYSRAGTGTASAGEFAPIHSRQANPET